MTLFERVFQAVVGAEGGYTVDPADPGNWTGGRCGSGHLRGTRYGISAAAYPALDIAGITLDDARAIYQRDYWMGVCGDQLPPPLALLVFDAAVNNGVNRAVRWLQQSAGVTVDGVLGARTLSAVQEADLTGLLSEFQAQRLLFMVALPTWRRFGLGWARRLCRMPIEALGIDQPSAAAA